MEKALVSVIVPVYNAQEYLDLCVESILTQTYKNLEILLVDDGSTDASPNICAKYGKKDLRVKVICQKNAGPSVARNHGLDVAKGEYIVFVDSDDIIRSEMIQTMVAAMDSYNTDLCICGFERFKEGWHQEYQLSPYSLTIFQSQKELASVYMESKTNMFGISIWAKMYRAEIIKTNNIRFDKNINYEEDCCFNIDYFKKVKTTAVLNNVFYRYRQMEQSLSKGYRKECFHFLINGLSSRKTFLTELNLEMKHQCLDNVFMIVIKNTLMKIYYSDLTRKEKIVEYEKITSYQEVQDVVKNINISKNRFTRWIQKSVMAQQPKKIHMILILYDMKQRMKSFF